MSSRLLLALSLSIGVAAAGFWAVRLRFRTTPPDEAPVDLRGAPIRAPIQGVGDNSTGAPAPVVGAVRANLPAAAPAIPTPDAEGYHAVGFELLASFPYEAPAEPLPEGATPASLPYQIPGSIRALNGLSVAIKGFMLPIRIENGLARELLLMRDQSMCCFGVIPKLNEWVSVRMRTQGVKPVLDQPVTLYGKLHVGETIEHGTVASLYALEGERLATALDW